MHLAIAARKFCYGGGVPHFSSYSSRQFGRTWAFTLSPHGRVAKEQCGCQPMLVLLSYHPPRLGQVYWELA